MKYLMAVLIICATLSFSLAQPAKLKDEDDEIDMFEEWAEECAAKEGAKRDDIDEALAFMLPSTQIGRCLQACLLEKYGIMKNNKLVIEISVAVAKKELGNAAEEGARDIANKCATVTDENRCEAAFKIMRCSEQASKARALADQFS